MYLSIYRTPNLAQVSSRALMAQAGVELFPPFAPNAQSCYNSNKCFFQVFFFLAGQKLQIKDIAAQTSGAVACLPCPIYTNAVTAGKCHNILFCTAAASQSS